MITSHQPYISQLGVTSLPPVAQLCIAEYVISRFEVDEFVQTDTAKVKTTLEHLEKWGDLPKGSDESVSIDYLGAKKSTLQFLNRDIANTEFEKIVVVKDRDGIQGVMIYHIYLRTMWKIVHLVSSRKQKGAGTALVNYLIGRAQTTPTRVNEIKATSLYSAVRFYRKLDFKQDGLDEYTLVRAITWHP